MFAGLFVTHPMFAIIILLIISFQFNKIYMKKVKSIAIGILITAVSILTLIAILSIWDVLSSDVLWKSISTIGIVAFGALIVVVAAQALEHKEFPSNTTNTPSSQA